MRTDDFDYYLPKELIAQTPLLNRSSSRLLVLNRESQTIEHRHFKDIIEYLKPGDVLVRNNTKVIPARLYGVKEETGAKVEVLLLKALGDDVWECLVGNARVVKVGSRVSFNEGLLVAECLSIHDGGIRHFKMLYDGVFYELLDKIGQMPLPPYIKTKLEDKNRYQTVYAKIDGSAAAPTAGFHFTPELFEEIKNKGIEVIDITLHVGLGTFRPVDVEDVENHDMHEESYYIDAFAAERLNKAKSNGQRIIAIGTTSVRTLEANYQKYGCFTACQDKTKIFIYPGYEFKAITSMITNFHLPKSTLVMLVSAFATKDLIMKAYAEAVKMEYRFFSFGDSMFII